YRSEELIDDAELGAIIDRAFADAGLHPDDIDAGVVILTGEALRRENAEAIASVLAEQRGEFVCATAGHHMESMLAAFGSGAAQAGFHWTRGDIADVAAMERVAEWMAEAVLASVSERPFATEVQSLFLTEPLPGMEGIDGVMFSGGVAEYVYQRETREFGDMG